MSLQEPSIPSAAGLRADDSLFGSQCSGPGVWVIDEGPVGSISRVWENLVDLGSTPFVGLSAILEVELLAKGNDT